ncbi:carboxypeptidase regulatory-like domain-containing protein [Candidatus Beckwithbacteria bacterium]|nr:carboxypeptidase regulatory-like domain-containing protein [Candidatus Beckwithbacteria bacterium]
MKKALIQYYFLFSLFTFLFFSLFVFPKKTYAYPQSEKVCYAQCATYKFVWQGSYCWDLFQQNCSVGKFGSIRKAISLMKDVYDAAKKGDISSFSVDTVFNAWFVCKPLIENCIVPQLQDCHNVCAQDELYYAPDISVGSPYGNFVYHGVVYNDRDHTLTFKVVNNGKAYAADIEAEASWGHTRNRDGQVSGGGQLFKETIPELIYFGARNGPPKTAGDIVGDFLIEESNFSKYLQFLKSDADNYNVPFLWLKTIPFTPPEGELTKVIFNVDPSQMIPEYYETNNTFILTIDKLPTPPSFQIDNFTQRLEQNTLNNFLIDFNIKNTGEENGAVTVKIFENKYNGNFDQTAIWQSTQTVQGLNQFNFNTFIAPDVSTDNAYCGKTKNYELVAFDNGQKVSSHEFSLPLYSGSVRGNVKDLFGKAVAGATVTASTGQSTTTSKNTGSFYLQGINQLGKVTITVTHPDFSQTETKELEFKMGDGLNPCDEGNLTLNQVDFTLKDQDVLFTITIKDRSGNLVNAHVMASNQDWRFDSDVPGTGPLPGMQPGEYFFTITAPGYKTIGQTVNAVPNNQNLEFVIEPLNGRLTDGGINIFSEPQLLWQLDRGEEIFSQMAATKDGKMVILYTTKNQNLSGSVYFLDSLTGNQIRVVRNTIATGGQSHACLDTSYDGNTTALFSHIGTFGTTKNSRNFLKLFDSSGHEFVSQEINDVGSAGECDVSPDGFYIYPFRLMNKGMYTYTRFDIEGIKNSKAPMSYPGLLHFTTSNNVIVDCPKGGGECLQTFNDTVITNLGNVNGNVRVIDSSQDTSSIAIITSDKAYLFRNANKTWEKDVVTKGHPLDISVSPGGKYAIYSTYVKDQNHRTIRIFTDNNLDKTPATLPSNREEDALFVHANDKGLFFATQEEKTIKYYQVGDYSTDYNPATPEPTPTGNRTSNNISYYENGTWHNMGEVTYYQLLPGRIYMANTTLTLNVEEPWGRMTFLEGTVFGTDNYLHPVLLKGQITADFSSPAKIYAIKFDRFDMDLFASKLAAFTAGTLDSNEYFLVKNVHTKFIVSNYENAFNVKVADGEVEVSGKDVAQKIEAGKQISIDQDNKVTESVYLGWKLYAIIAGVLVLISGILLFIYRKTKVGKTIIGILNKTAKLILKYGKILIISFWKYFKKTLALLYKIVKINLQKNTKKRIKICQF